MKMLINGELVDSLGKETFSVINPANNEKIDDVPKATKEDIDLAIDAAKKAFPLWSKVPVWKRGEILYKFVELVKENKEDLAQTLCKENGKPITEARAEIHNITISFPAFIEHAKHYYGKIIPAGQEEGQERTLQLITREPIGIVACIIPFNFPCDLFDQKVAPALMMGNAAIVFPSSDNPLTLLKLSALLNEAGVTPGAIQAISAPGAVKEAAVTNPAVHLITLTGSTEVGIRTAILAGQNLTHTALELGGNDAFIVLDDADVDLAVKETIWGRMYNTGQVCCASKRFLVHSSRVEEYIEKAETAIKALKVGDPSLPDTQIGCLISEKAAIKVEEQVLQTISEGAKLVMGGKREGAFYEPTILRDVPKGAAVAKDMEIFGPVVSVISFETDEEAVEIANSSIFGLSSCVFSKNQNRAFQIASKMEAGGAVINGASFYRSFEMPFGGWKHSGIGTEGVESTFDEMTVVKTIVLKNIY